MSKQNIQETLITVYYLSSFMYIAIVPYPFVALISLCGHSVHAKNSCLFMSIGTKGDAPFCTDLFVSAGTRIITEQIENFG